MNFGGFGLDSAPPTPGSSYSTVAHTRPHTQMLPAALQPGGRYFGEAEKMPKLKITAPSSSSRNAF